MAAPDLSLLAKRRLGPLFVVQFLGALNDNLLKFALLFLASFELYAAAPEKAEILGIVATAIFILPYFLFSALAGQVADKIDKARLVRWVKAAEIAIMTLALVGFALKSVPLLLGVLFLMGCHSTLFGPAKYAILPQHLGPHEIMGGTGLVEAGTFLAILAGQLLAGLVRPWEAALIAMGFALLGFLASLAVPAAPPAAAGLSIDLNPLRSTWTLLRNARHARSGWLCILGISWFFAVGAVLLSEFAPLASGVLGAGPPVVTLFLLVFSVSIAVGSVLVNKLLAGQVSARYVPVSALVMAACLIDLWLSTGGFEPVTRGAGIQAFLATPGSWRILFDLLGLAFAGGMFIVPLYALLQTQSPPAERSRVIAANNIVNAAVTVLVVAIVTAMLADGIPIPGLIATLGVSTLLVALAAFWLLPETAITSLVKRVLR